MSATKIKVIFLVLATALDLSDNQVMGQAIDPMIGFNGVPNYVANRGLGYPGYYPDYTLGNGVPNRGLGYPGYFPDYTPDVDGTGNGYGQPDFSLIDNYAGGRGGQCAGRKQKCGPMKKCCKEGGLTIYCDTRFNEKTGYCAVLVA